MKFAIVFGVSFSLLICSVAYACEPVEVAFGPKEMELLEALQKKEEAGGIASVLAAWGPVAGLLTSNAAENLLVVSTTDWAVWTRSVASIEKITRCSQVKSIDYYLVETADSDDSKAFFRCLRDKYDQNC